MRKSFALAWAGCATLGLATFSLAMERDSGLLKQVFHRVAKVQTAAKPAPKAAEATQHNTLSPQEKTQGFELLFNGKDLQGWDNKGNWIVEDGAISRKDKGGSITYTTRKVPDNFELQFEWKVAKGSNSGIYYRPGQYEYQILDNKVHNDGKNPRTSAASLYFCMPPSKDATKPVGEWNSGKVVCKGTVIQHWLNGVKVIDFDYTDPKYAWEVELLKYRGANLAARGANLNMQDHGDPVWYRSIKWRELKDSDQLDRSPVTPGKVAEDIIKREQAYIDNAKKKSK